MEAAIAQSLLKVTGALTPASKEALTRELERHINWMILHDFNGLVQILYRMDVDEKKLRGLLQQHGDTDAAYIIAALMIERQVQKIKTRQQFRSPDDIPEEDKW